MYSTKKCKSMQSRQSRQSSIKSELKLNYMSNSKALQKLIEKRMQIDNCIVEIVNMPNSAGNEQQIKLLQRKKKEIVYEIEGLCSPHMWGKPNYGYISCTVCEKLRNTRHA